MGCLMRCIVVFWRRCLNAYFCQCLAHFSTGLEEMNIAGHNESIEIGVENGPQ